MHVAGGTLDDWNRRAEHPTARKLELLRGLALGIAAVHSHGLLHRDLATTAEGLGRDGAAYRRLMGPIVRAADDGQP